MLTMRQIEWASQHDWYHSADLLKGIVFVKDWEYFPDEDTHVCVTKSFDAIEPLRAWAGY